VGAFLGRAGRCGGAAWVVRIDLDIDHMDYI